MEELRGRQGPATLLRCTLLPDGAGVVLSLAPLRLLLELPLPIGRRYPLEGAVTGTGRVAPGGLLSGLQLALARPLTPPGAVLDVGLRIWRRVVVLLLVVPKCLGSESVVSAVAMVVL